MNTKKIIKIMDDVKEIEKTRQHQNTVPDLKPKKPDMYKVILHNDDYTPAEIVAEILHRVFNMDGRKAWEVMVAAHKSGLCVCGIFTHDIAETRVQQATDIAKAGGHALKFSIEKE